MADQSAFRDLAERFERLQERLDPREQLQASYVTQSRVALERQARSFASLYVRRVNPAEAQECEREATDHARLILEGSTEHSAYHLTGGRKDDADRGTLHKDWTALAVIGARLTGFTGSHEAARDAWLDLLRQRSSDYRPINDDGGFIKRLCRASAGLCTLLESEATPAEFDARASRSTNDQQRTARQERSEQSVATAVLDEASNDASATSGRTSVANTPLARNLDHLRMQCGWSYEKMAAAVGPTKATVVRHITKGVNPQPSALREYAQAISMSLKISITPADLLDPDLPQRLRRSARP